MPTKKAARKKAAKKKTHKLTPTEWFEIKNLWCAGDHTYSQLAKRFGIAEATIRGKACNEDWGKDKKKVLAKKEQTIGEIFAELGMPKKKLLRLIKDGAEDTHMLKNVKKNVRIKKWRKVGKEWKQHTELTAIDQTIEVIDNHNTREYRKMAKDMAGWTEAPKAPKQDDDLPDDPIPVVSHLKKP